MAYIYVELGDRGRVTVDEDKISIGKSRKLARAVVEVKKKHTALAKHPMNDDETVEEWQKRIKPLVDAEKSDREDTSRRDGESTEAYLSRIMDCSSEEFELYYDMLNVIQSEVGEPAPHLPNNTVPVEAFESAPVEAIVRFIRAVLAKAKINVDAVFPGKFELAPDLI